MLKIPKRCVKSTHNNLLLITVFLLTDNDATVSLAVSTEKLLFFTPVSRLLAAPRTAVRLSAARHYVEVVLGSVAPLQSQPLLLRAGRMESAHRTAENGKSLC